MMKMARRAPMRAEAMITGTTMAATFGPPPLLTAPSWPAEIPVPVGLNPSVTDVVSLSVGRTGSLVDCSFVVVGSGVLSVESASVVVSSGSSGNVVEVSSGETVSLEDSEMLADTLGTIIGVRVGRVDVGRVGSSGRSTSGSPIGLLGPEPISG
jgi:hypothetical protein